MSLGAIDFGLIVDGAVIIVENCLRRLGRAAARARPRRSRCAERLDDGRSTASKQVLGADRLRRGDHHHRLPADPRAHRRRGEDVPADGADGDLRARRGLRALADLRARRWSRSSSRGRVAGEGERRSSRWREARSTSRSLRCALRCAGAVVARRRRRVFAGSLLLFAPARPGVRADARRAGHRDARDAHPEHRASTQSTEMQLEVERAVASFPEVAFVFSKTGTAEMASDPMPPNVSDTFIILKPRDGVARPGRHQGRTLRERDRGGARAACSGNNYEFTQPIQMRFNELIAGVRGDVAVKVFGDDFDAHAAPARSGSRACCAAIPRRRRREGRADRRACR